MSARRYGGPHGYGHRPDPSGFETEHPSRLLGASALDTPASVSRKAACLAGSGIMDQFDTSSCVGHAIVGAVETRLAMLGAPTVHKSPLCVYDLARCIDRVPVGRQLPPLEDIGAAPSQAFRGVTEWGICDYGVRPTDVARINAEPSLGELEHASDFELVGYYRLVATGAELVHQVRQALAQGYPVTFAIDADEEFEGYHGGVLGAPDLFRMLGGHYMYAVGYRTGEDAETIVEFANSWGTSWGVGGFGEGDESFIAGWSDVYVIDVRTVGGS